jgi:hypothetical protein
MCESLVLVSTGIKERRLVFPAGSAKKLAASRITANIAAEHRMTALLARRVACWPTALAERKALRLQAASA